MKADHYIITLLIFLPQFLQGKPNFHNALHKVEKQNESQRLNHTLRL